MAKGKKKAESLTEEEIRENSVPEGFSEEPKAEPEAPKAVRPPKDYIEKALELVGKMREADTDQALFAAEQNLKEALKFLARHDKKKGGA